MKKLLFTLIISSTTQALFAQEDKLFISDSSKPILQKQLLFPNRIIGNTNNGTIYALPQDHMPVFVPDSLFAYNMPVSGRTTQPGTIIPNPYYPKKNFGNGPITKVDSVKRTTPFKIYQFKERPAPKNKMER